MDRNGTVGFIALLGAAIALRIAVVSQCKIDDIGFAGATDTPKRNSIGGTLNSKSEGKKKWTKPELKRIGDIGQVAGVQAPSAQGNGQKS